MAIDPSQLPLKEIHLPDPIKIWPLPLGWWLLVFLLISALLTWIFFKFFYSRSSLKKEATYALNRIEKKLASGFPAIESLREISILLRTLTIAQGQKEVAHLTGLSWLKFLDQRLGGSEFSQGAGAILLSGPYQQNADKKEVEELLKLCYQWVRHL